MNPHKRWFTTMSYAQRDEGLKSRIRTMRACASRPSLGSCRCSGSSRSVLNTSAPVGLHPSCDLGWAFRSSRCTGIPVPAPRSVGGAGFRRLAGGHCCEDRGRGAYYLIPPRNPRKEVLSPVIKRLRLITSNSPASLGRGVVFCYWF